MNRAAPETVIYGWHAVHAALAHNSAAVAMVWVAGQRQDVRLRALQAQAEQQGVALHIATRAQLDELAPGAHHQGVVARLHEAAPRTAAVDLPALIKASPGPALLLVLDGVQDPHNLGACLRSASAAGALAVIVPNARAAGLTPVVRKVASGAAETLPLIQVPNLARTLRQLQAQGVWLVGAAASAATPVYEADLRAPCALILGAEGSGLRRLTRELCDALVSIPMAGSMASLNVAVAAGVLLFEAVRQRRA